MRHITITRAARTGSMCLRDRGDPEDENAHRHTDGRGRCPRPQRLHQGRGRPRRGPGLEGDGLSPRLGRHSQLRPQQYETTAPLGRDADAGERAHDRPRRGHLPAYLARAPRAHADGRSSTVNQGGRDDRVRRCHRRLYRPRLEGTGEARHRRADAHRWRRHPVLRRPPRPGRRACGVDPEDDGQRCLRHRLLHRLLDRGHPQRDLHRRPADDDRQPRAHRGRRAVRPAQR